ncbi:MAG: BadF/BadG/BcrA/BcrD ATPase family protein [Thermoanaerobaculia bacterium]
MTSLFIGVDGGGTHTRAVVADATLTIRGRGSGGPANAATRALPRVVQAVTDAVTDAAEHAGIEPSTATAVVCGLAGIEAAGIGPRLTAALEELYGRGKVLVTHDARIALAGALEGPVDGPGLVLIAGTGAIVFGRGTDGTEGRTGGWGPVLGDEGSGYVIARQGLAAVVRDLDGRGPRTRIRDFLFASEGMKSSDELLQRIYRADGGPGDVAAYFPIVLKAAREGDGEALRILGEAVEELALAVITLVRKLRLEKETFGIATVGGVFSAGALILEPLNAHIRTVAPMARLHPPAYPPEIGAVRLALARMGIPR